jgi:hypothetical protein
MWMSSMATVWEWARFLRSQGTGQFPEAIKRRKPERMTTTIADLRKRTLLSVNQSSRGSPDISEPAEGFWSSGGGTSVFR